MTKSFSADRQGIRAHAVQRSLESVEPLEARIFLSAAESATAQLHLVSTTGTQASPVFNYDITLTNTGTSNLGSFWFAWVPGEDFLPSVPLAESSPAGWGSADGASSTPIITGEHSSTNGSAIQWVAQSPSALLAPGHSLSGFTFSTPDSPAALAGQSPTHPASAVLTSFVYMGAPLTDAGFQFAVTAAPATGAAGTATTLVSSTPTAASGALVTFTATVAPTAPGATPTGTVSFLNGSATLGSAPVGADGTASFSTSSLPAGVDSVTAAYGGDATYAGSTSAVLTETIQPPMQTAALTPAINKSTLPASVVTGQPVHGAITVALTNGSGASVKGSALVEVFASADGTIDEADTVVARLTHAVNVKATKSLKETLTVKSLPAGLASGAYQLLARVVGPDGIPGDAVTGPALHVAAPTIALSETFTKLTLPATAAAGSKVHAVATLKLTNNGNVVTSGPAVSVGIFASTEGIDDEAATALNRISKKLRIAPGKSITVTVPLNSLVSLSPGTYDVFARVVDPNQQTSTADSGKPIVVT